MKESTSEKIKAETTVSPFSLIKLKIVAQKVHRL